MVNIRIKTTPDDHYIANMTALAIGLHMIEAVFPSPIPGVKPGVANIITLLVMYQFGIKTAIWVSLLRVLASSLMIGQFLTPSFFLSLTGALFSLVLLSIARLLPQAYFSAISLSILAAFAHIGGQLIVVRLWLIPHNNISYLIPIFASAALFFGLVNGLVTQNLIQHKKAPD